VEVTLDHARLLGLPQDENYLAYLSGMISGRMLSPCELACIVANIPLVTCDATVEYIPTIPMHRRMMIRTSGLGAVAASEDLYMGRPAFAENYTFTEYFTIFKVHKTGVVRRWVICRCYRVTREFMRWIPFTRAH
jgi:hypothetical protein